MLVKLLKRIDNFFVLFFGLKKSIRPVAVRKKKNTILVLVTEPNQRYTKEEKIENLLPEMKSIEPADKKKLGLAVGKTIASDLQIYF